ncbi:hypothetical protein EniLVp02_0258 [Vibrio phage EniLVp02]
MAQLYYIHGNTSQTDHFTPKMSLGFAESELIGVRFYTDEGRTSRVYPTLGSITYLQTADEDKIDLRTVDAGTVQLVDLTAPDVRMPNAYGAALYGKLSFSGVTPGLYFEAIVWRN